MTRQSERGQAGNVRAAPLDAIANQIKALLKALGVWTSPSSSPTCSGTQASTYRSASPVGNIDDALARACVSENVFSLYYKLTVTDH